MRLWLIPFLLLVTARSQAQKAEIGSVTVPQVIVNGNQTDAEENRNFIAGKVVLGKKRILESGVQNAGEFLVREPAISVGKDGRLGLLGLPGYTQVLVDGLPYQSDPFAIDLSRIERIEIVKSSTAITGPVGIAGTINIILRKTERKPSTQLRLGSTAKDGAVGTDISLSGNQKIQDTPFSYSWTLSNSRSVNPVENRYLQRFTDLSLSSSSVLNYTGTVFGKNAIWSTLVSSDIAWQIDTHQKINFSPELGSFRVKDSSLESRATTNYFQSSNAQHSASKMDSYSFPLLWAWQRDEESNLLVKLQINGSEDKNNTLQLQNIFGSSLEKRVNLDKIKRRNFFLNADYSTVAYQVHELSVGTKITQNRLSTSYVDTIDDKIDTSLSSLGSRSAARVNRIQLFAQDEWRISRSLAVNLGISGEQRRYDLDEGRQQTKTSYDMWSPSFHLSKKLSGDIKRQVRLSVARSYAPPDIDQLQTRPTINAFASCGTDLLCQENSIDTADVTGNPNLKPERSLGLNLSYTNGFGRDSEAVVEIYSRRIKDKIGFEYLLTDVPWAESHRYVYRPTNLGEARVLGLDAEMRLSGKDFDKCLVNAELHGSIGFARSHLSDIPGPDNHLADQTPWRMKLGGSYTLVSNPLKLGFEASFLPGDWAKNNIDERIYQSHRSTVGLNATWKLKTDSRVTFNMDNLLHHTTSRISEVRNETGRSTRSTFSDNYVRFAIQFETKL